MSFRKLLIANRGEIAIRIARAAADAGIATVAIFPADDALSLHVRVADEAIEIPGRGARAYLDIGSVVKTAKAAGCDAVHPGYGFLSENADFAKACAAEGIAFVGPSVAALELFGDKVAARQLAKRCGVPIIAGTSGPSSQEEIKAFFDSLGKTAAIVIKAMAGGGGRGMRVVHSDATLLNAIMVTQGEALAAFGNAEVYMEKFLEKPRHIEIQVMADHYGNVVHLGERDCSLQRRHQKVIEEAPAPGITPKQRKTIGDRCIEACREVGYRGAGTLEFLYEGGEFYFIEMNTRVQVEHPVTEQVTGIDIVKAQLRIAGGERMQWTQNDIVIRGHAIECRINAEDPKGFIPSPGPVKLFHAPGGPGIRVDSHLYSGYTVPPYYDSLIGKLIAYGEDRDTAIARMKNALSEMVIEGIKTNIPLHQEIFNHAAFRSGGLDIHYLERRLGLK
jgi:acetyl-CoA carboxylase, biotin carboxylase subunit